MAINTLLTVHSVDEPLDNLQPMLAVAGSLRAHLDVLILGHAPELPSPVYMETAAIDWNIIYREATEAARQRQRAVEQLAADADAEVSVTIETPTSAGVSDCVVRHALYTDLIVIPHHSARHSGTQKQVFDSVLFDAAQPVLVLGADHPPMNSISRVLIGWSPVPQAARAIRHSLPFIADATAVHLTAVNAADDAAADSAEAMAAYLQRHDLPVTIDRLAAEDEVANVLIDHADTINADLVVIGGYGHSRLREWILGGTTRFLLESIRRPVLVAH